MNDRERLAQDLHDNAPQGLIDFLDCHDIAADVWFMNYAETLDGWYRQGVSVETTELLQALYDDVALWRSSPAQHLAIGKMLYRIAQAPDAGKS